MLESKNQTRTNRRKSPFFEVPKNLIYAPGRYTGYAPKTLPGVREAIEEERWADVDRYASLTGAVLDAYADKLDECVRLINDADPVTHGG
jgi:N-acetylated-alpha-linked acidic dipeptidase